MMTRRDAFEAIVPMTVAIKPTQPAKPGRWMKVRSVIGADEDWQEDAGVVWFTLDCVKMLKEKHRFVVTTQDAFSCHPEDWASVVKAFEDYLS